MCMATMASTSHGLSVWANSCIKNPINPKTGLSASIKERSSINFSDVLREFDDSHGHFGNEGGANRNMLTSSVDELQAAKEEEFYDKLQQLKTENKKTLEAYEKLYREQLFLTGVRNSQSECFQYDKSGIDREIDSGVDGLVVNGQAQDAELSSSILKKPPAGKSHSAVRDVPTASKGTPRMSHQSMKKQRPSSAPIERSQSLDDSQWKELLLSPNANNDSENYIITSKDTMVNDYENMRAKINNMWEDFNISQPLQRRHSFSSSRKKISNNDDDKKSKKKEWRHRITVPEPFRMSIRDSLKETKKTSAQLELEARRLEKQKEEEAECEKKFKAQPAPSHIYVPLYEEIMERNNTRRKYVKQISEELIKSQVKPFNFELREQEKRHQKMLTQQKPPQKAKKPGFKANAVPKHIFNRDIDEKLNEDEELRKIRIRMRSKELLREASLPPNMAEREKLKEQERKDKARRAKLAVKKSRPKSAHVVPDYDALYREFRKELSQRKSTKEGTVVHPFELETNHIRSSRDKILKDIENDEKQLKENRWPYSSSRETPRSSLKYLGALSTSMDSIPTISTKAADLRNIKVKKEKARNESRQAHDEEAEARRRARESKLRRYLNERTVNDDVPRPKETIAARLKRIKQEDKERQEAYQRELDEMKARVDSSPLLVEKFMKENAKKEAERKFKTTMRDVGLNETEIINSHRAASIRSENSYRSGSNEDLYVGSSDLTYNKGDPEREYSDEAEYEY